MGKKQDSGESDASRQRASRKYVVGRPTRDVQTSDDCRNPKTLDRDHGTEVAVAKVLWIATASEREV